MIDDAFKNKRYFPEKYVFDVALSNPDGIVYLSDSLTPKDVPGNVRVLDPKKGQRPRGCGVFGCALAILRELGYERIILVGCDYCRRGRLRYWWETDLDMLQHPENMKHIKKAIPDDWTPQPHMDRGSTKYFRLRLRKGGSRYVRTHKAPNGELVYIENQYLKQRNVAHQMIKALNDEGVSVVKFTDTGLLEIPSIDDICDTQLLVEAGK
jgi:hypothetical protein